MGMFLLLEIITLLQTLIYLKKLTQKEISVYKYMKRNNPSLQCILIEINSDFTKKDSPITIGRGSTAKIRIKSNELSRIQCSLEFNDNKWYISDGDGSKNSTNGTWLYAEDPIEIHDQMTFKAGSLLFQTSFHS